MSQRRPEGRLHHGTESPGRRDADTAMTLEVRL
jgi:hypothetical protein